MSKLSPNSQREMAYAAVASLLQTVDLTLNCHQRSISPEFENQITSIHQHACSLQSFIDGSSDRVYNWEETIREVTVRAEDTIELILSNSLLESSIGSSRSESEMGKYEVSYSLDELEKVKEEIESIASRVKGGRRIEAPVGSDKELMEIVSRLRGGSSSLETIAICGSGGMGKTALAGDAYNHPLTVEHFDVRAGSIVTREYTLLRVVEDLLRCMKAEFSIDERLLQLLGHKRYLIVLFDVWTPDVLGGLKTMLPDHGNGSRIIFTSRSSELAKSAHHIVEMHFLDEDKSWNLLREKILKGDPCPFQLESIGKMIAGSCRGHPLSIEVVSGILVDDETEAAWEDVSKSMKVASEDYEVLYLGYVYLPHHLRPCFLFLGIYPPGLAIYVSRLVKLWIAEGFVEESGSKSLEEIGKEYVEDLVARSLVSVSRRKSNGQIKSITIHDLVRGMCLRQAHRDNSCRSVSNLNDSEGLLTNAYGSTIRTLVLHPELDKVDLGCRMRNVRLLRILSLSNVYTYHLSDDVFELFHLRYLALGFCFC